MKGTGRVISQPQFRRETERFLERVGLQEAMQHIADDLTSFLAAVPVRAAGGRSSRTG
jgi:hypothetical protein